MKSHNLPPCFLHRGFTASSIQLCLPGSSVHQILQARILEWVAIPFSRPIFLTQGSHLSLLHCRQILYHLSYREAQSYIPLKSQNFPPCCLDRGFTSSSTQFSYTYLPHRFSQSFHSIDYINKQAKQL